MATKILLNIIKVIQIFVFLLVFNIAEAEDQKGYILYCPCMGRFGNQADHFLGVLSFAKGLGRTLVLPPWIEYVPAVAKSNQIPFIKYFKLEPLQEFYDVITMDFFMEEIAPILWPPEKRIALCYMPRQKSDGCSPKEGNPFGPFWDAFNVDFVGSEFYQPFTYDIHHNNMAENWGQKYPIHSWPVLAFTGAPAAFPVTQENTVLHKYLHWSSKVDEAAEKFVKDLPRGPYVSIHLRHGVDWVRACSHIEKSPALFAGPQCLGYRGEHGPGTHELCLPSDNTIIKQLKRTLKSVGASSVFVASDADHRIEFLQNALQKMNVSVHKLPSPNAQVELAILGRSNHFIGNCISSFTAFAKRERDAKGFPSSFWAFPIRNKDIHIEL